MGNDGGSIPTRRELVKEAARDPSTTQLKETQKELQQYHWTTCPLSNQPLSAPIVSDSSGTLYSKSAVLEFLIDVAHGDGDKTRSGVLEGPESGIRGIRDVVEVKFETEKVDGMGKTEATTTSSKWVCPITNKALGPGVKAVYLVPCGHAFLDSAVKEMSGENCLQCNEPYTPNNIIPILPISLTDKERLQNRIQHLKDQNLTHSLKPVPGAGKKRKKHLVSEPALHDPPFSNPAPLLDSVSHSSEKGGIRNEATASLTAKVLAEEQARKKQRRMGTNENLKSLFSSKNGMDEKHTDFMTRGFSIPAGAKR